MFTLIVTMDVKEDDRRRFLEATSEQARGATINEPGCLRFDVLVDDADPNRFYLYECYRDEQAEEESNHTAHFNKWWPVARECLRQPYAAARCHAVASVDAIESQSALKSAR